MEQPAARATAPDDVRGRSAETRREFGGTGVARQARSHRARRRNAFGPQHLACFPIMLRETDGGSWLNLGLIEGGSLRLGTCTATLRAFAGCAIQFQAVDFMSLTIHFFECQRDELGAAPESPLSRDARELPTYTAGQGKQGHISRFLSHAFDVFDSSLSNRGV